MINKQDSVYFLPNRVLKKENTVLNMGYFWFIYCPKLNVTCMANLKGTVLRESSAWHNRKTYFDLVLCYRLLLGLVSASDGVLSIENELLSWFYKIRHYITSLHKSVKLKRLTIEVQALARWYRTIDSGIDFVFIELLSLLWLMLF